MFCPNCGTKNDDTATPCKKCGFKLSGASAPKFRGTMMLNSDQSVQDLVEEHRKKLAEAGLPQEAPAEAGGPTPALPSVGSTPPKAVLQPPRATLPKRRMGTMLGVAPQVGGVRPPPEEPPPSPAPAPVSAGAATSVDEGGPVSTADPFAGTVAFGVVSPDAPQTAGPAVSLAAGRTEAFAAVPTAAAPTPSPALVSGKTEAFEAPAVPELPAPPAVEPAATPLGRGRTEAFEASPARGATEALESSPAGAVEPSPAAHTSSVPPAPQRRQVRPLEIFLIVASCGLYGLVLWARQRKPS